MSYIAYGPTCTFLAVGRRSWPYSLQVTNFTFLSMDRFLVLSNFFHDTNGCVKVLHVVLVLKLLYTNKLSLASNINYWAGLQKHGNHERHGKLHSNHMTRRLRKGHNKACVWCLTVSKTDLWSQIYYRMLIINMHT